MFLLFIYFAEMILQNDTNKADKQFSVHKVVRSFMLVSLSTEHTSMSVSQLSINRKQTLAMACTTKTATAFIYASNRKVISKTPSYMGFNMSSVNGLQMQKCITSVSCCFFNPDIVCPYHYNTRICTTLINIFPQYEV